MRTSMRLGSGAERAVAGRPPRVYERPYEGWNPDDATIDPMSSQGIGREDPRPGRIHADRAARTLDIEWSDGHHTSYDFERLRWLCPCAFCRGEAGQPGWLDSDPTLTDTQLTLTDLALVGQYAVAPTWADGHHTGYYTFQLLRSACPCPEDTARRAAERHPGHGLP
jgi:DUF971 family protein